MTRVRTGVIEIGLKSACCEGAWTLSTGRMEACFHCFGMVEVARDKLKSLVMALMAYRIVGLPI